MMSSRSAAPLTSQEHDDLRILAAERWRQHAHRQPNACKDMLRAVRVNVKHTGKVRDRLKTNADASPDTVAVKKLVELSQL